MSLPRKTSKGSGKLPVWILDLDQKKQTLIFLEKLIPRIMW